ncbi:MAG: hypothetical protein IRZ04_13440 [Rhodospirillales bacterium]|nr:hypothetical protein [Rhodospirillales bacterium]
MTQDLPNRAQLAVIEISRLIARLESVAAEKGLELGKGAADSLRTGVGWLVPAIARARTALLVLTGISEEDEAEAMHEINNVALLEGWGLFSTRRGPRIRRDAVQNAFKTDDEAIRHVSSLARSGSYVHRHAFRLHSKARSRSGKRPRRAAAGAACSMAAKSGAPCRLC